MNAEGPQENQTCCITDLRIRILIFLVFFVAPAFLNDIRSLALVFALLLAVFIASGQPVKKLPGALWKIFPFVVFVILINLLLAGDGITPRFSPRSLQSALAAALKVFDLYFAAAVFIMTTSKEQVAQGTALILKPFSKNIARKSALYAFIVMSFVPIFAEELRRIQVVQSFRRGGRAKGLTAKARSAPTIMVPLIISALNRSSQLAAVVELRRLESKFPCLVPASKPAPTDYLWLAVVPLGIALSIFIQGT